MPREAWFSKPTEGKKNLLRQTLMLRTYFSEGNDFLVYGAITAMLRNIPAVALGNATLMKSLPFRCGE
jgi:hypothetical protein